MLTADRASVFGKVIEFSMRGQKPISLFLLQFFFFIAPAHAAELMKGPAFTDPSIVQPMPEGWKEQPIRHDPETGRADVVVTLDQHLYPLFADYIKKYAARQGIKVRVDEGTCGITAGKLARKTADVGGFCCPPGEADRLPGLRFHTVGIMPVAVLVHPNNPVGDVDIRQVREIFSGKYYRWSEIKDLSGRHGKNIRIEAIGRLHCKLRPGHWRLLLDNEDLFSPNLTEVGTIPDMISLVARMPGAIGYEVPMMVDRYAKQGKVKILRLNGAAPDVSALAAGRYPLYRTLNLTTWEGKAVENKKAEKLVRQLLKEAERLEGRYDFVPAASLKREGWKFKGDELVGEP
jgi:phosphate transport system substrate-binding protein